MGRFGQRLGKFAEARRRPWSIHARSPPNLRQILSDTRGSRLTLFKSKRESIQTVGPDNPNVWPADPAPEPVLAGSIPRPAIERPAGERPPFEFPSDSDARRPLLWGRPQATTSRDTGVKTDPRDHSSLPSGLLRPSTNGPDARLPSQGARDYDQGGGRQVHMVPPVVDRIGQLLSPGIPDTSPSAKTTPGLTDRPIFIRPTSDPAEVPRPDSRFLDLIRRRPPQD